MGQAEFQARISRIEKRKGHGRHARTQLTSVGHLFRNALWPLSVPATFALGIGLVIFARYARFHLVGLPEDTSEAAQAISLCTDLLVALMVAFVIRQATRWRSGLHMTMQTLGMSCGSLCLHMAVHRWPDPFIAFFSPAWVDHVISTTEPNAILFLTVAT